MIEKVADPLAGACRPWPRPERARQTLILAGRGGRITTVSRRGLPKKSPRPRSSRRQAGLKPEQPCPRSTSNSFPDSSSRRWGSGQATGPPRPFRKARKNPSASRSSKRSFISSPAERRGNAESASARTAEATEGHPRSSGRALQQEPLEVEQTRSALPELPQGVEQPLRGPPGASPSNRTCRHYTAPRATAGRRGRRLMLERRDLGW